MAKNPNPMGKPEAFGAWRGMLIKLRGRTGLREHLASMECLDKIPIEDREGSGEGRGMRYRGVWDEIIKVGIDLDNVGIRFTLSFMCKIGNGLDTSFWEDRWVDNYRLCDKFARLFHLDICKGVGCQKKKDG
nr:RNA-directed DNA polymerase, eukaryota, reverse transcriptase zinc-binding domain protein [Tanacetum cinerariifolium]